MKGLTVLEHKEQRVLTTAQLAEGYGADAQVVTNNFNRNKSRYIDGKHYFALSGEDKRAFLNQHQFGLGSKKAAKIYLWTEKGALLHAKSLNTNQAWEVYDELVETYFRARDVLNTPVTPELPKTFPEALRQLADAVERIEEQKPLVTFAETVKQSKDGLLMREFAKLCCKDGIETGERRLYKKLREWKMIFPHSTEPYQEYIDRGYFERIEGTHETNHGVGLHGTTRVLPKGQIYIIDRLRKEATNGSSSTIN